MPRKPGRTTGLTPNQLVAHNLRQLRVMHGWTQDDAGGRLEQFLGARWSKATWSQAEGASGDPKARSFSADELWAFARLFDVPVGWLYLPPSDDEPVDVSPRNAKAPPLSTGDLIAAGGILGAVVGNVSARVRKLQGARTVVEAATKRLRELGAEDAYGALEEGLRAEGKESRTTRRKPSRTKGER